MRMLGEDLLPPGPVRMPALIPAALMIRMGTGDAHSTFIPWECWGYPTAPTVLGGGHGDAARLPSVRTAPR